MTDIFLSYNEKDRETARRVAAMLETVGWTVWWDRRIPAGESWRSVLDKALNNMRCMIVLWSARSIESEWVYEEASEGRRQDKLVPVMIEAVRPPAGFREIQAADLTAWDGSREFEGMRLLIGDLENLLGKPGAATSDRAPASDKDTSGGAARADHGRPYDPADLQGATTSTSATVATAATDNRPRRWKLAGALAGALLLAGAVAYLALSARDVTVKSPPVKETPPPIPAPAEPALVTPTPSLTPSPAPSPAPPMAAPVTLATPQGAALPTVTSIPPSASTSALTRPHVERLPAIKRADSALRPTSARCSDLLARVQLGETLSEEAQSTFKKECRQ